MTIEEKKQLILRNSYLIIFQLLRRISYRMLEITEFQGVTGRLKPLTILSSDLNNIY